MKQNRGKMILLLLAMIISSAASGQFLDTLRTAFKNESRLIGGLGGRNSLLSGEPVRIYQLFGGLDYSNVFRVQLGYSLMLKPVNERIIFDRFTSHADTLDVQSSISYLSTAFEYSFYRKGRWKLTVPLQIGIGINKIRQYDLDGNPHKFSDKMIIPVETGVNAIYYINTWLGVKAGSGVRFVGGKNVLADLSGPYYYIGAAVFFDEIYRMVAK